MSLGLKNPRPWSSHLIRHNPSPLHLPFHSYAVIHLRMSGIFVYWQQKIRTFRKNVDGLYCVQKFGQPIYVGIFTQPLIQTKYIYSQCKGYLYRHITDNILVQLGQTIFKGSLNESRLLSFPPSPTTRIGHKQPSQAMKLHYK